MKINDFLARFPEVETEQDGWVVPCPTHNDSHPSLRVAVGRNGSLLLRCRAGCKTENVLQSLGLGFGDLRGVETDGAPVARSTATPASDTEVTKLAVELDRWATELDLGWTEDGEPMTAATRYVFDRFGLGPAETQLLRLGVTDDLSGGTRVVVPFLDPQGVARGYQARALSQDAKVRWLGARSPKGASWSKLAFLKANGSYDQVVITEGPSDGLTVVGAGYDAIAVRGAAVVNDRHVVDQIAEWVGEREAVIAGDSDNAGAGFTAALLAGLRERKVAVAALQVPESDVADWRATDPAGFARSFQEAVKKLRFSAAGKIELSDFDTTDLATAKRYREYLRSQGSDIRFTAEAGFFILDRGVWLQDTLDKIRTTAHAVAEQLQHQADDLAEQVRMMTEDERDARPDIVKLVPKVRRYARHAASKQGIDAALTELRALRDVAISITDLDQHPHLLAVANGTVDLRTMVLTPTNPADLLSRRLDTEYHPEARAPRWEQFLKEIFPSYADTMPEFLRRLIGYGITGYTDEQCFAVLWGTGANGKSVLTEVLTRIFRPITTTTPFSTFEVKPGGNSGVPNDIAALKGSRLVMASEGEAGKPMAEAMLKRLTGRDMIAARFMRQEFFEFLPTFLLMLATNYKPKFRGQDEGLWRRVKLIPFERFFTPDERDPRLHEKLMEEAEGILAWAVSGAHDWHRDKSLREPKVIKDLAMSYKYDSDALAGFLPGTFVIDEDSSSFISRKDLWDAYRAWCEEEEAGRDARWSQRAFYSALEERGAKRVKNSGAHGFKAIRKATEDELDEMLATPAPVAPAQSAPETRATLGTVPSAPPSLDDI